MKIPFFNTLNTRVGIDFGTRMMRIGTPEKGILIEEATCLALDAHTQEIVAFGTEALEMNGAVGKKIKLVYPIVSGEIADADALVALTKLLIGKAEISRIFFNPAIMATIPANATEATREVATQVLYRIGASESYTVTQPLAASIGAGVPIADSSGSFVCGLGEGLVEAAVISLGSSIAHQSMAQAGGYYRLLLQTHLEKKLQLRLSASVLETVIREVVSLDQATIKEKLIGGQDLLTEAPKEVLLTSAEVFEPSEHFGHRVEQLIMRLLSKMPTQLTVDSIDKGLLLTGGLAQLTGLQTFLTHRLGILVAVVEEPEQAAIKGVLNAIEHLEEFKKSIVYQYGG